jgi:hypothetical protein
VEVLNLNDFDDEGEVFGRPDQVEINVIIKNGLVIVCEIKSSMSKAEMYIFDRQGRRCAIIRWHFMKNIITEPLTVS